jgi:hypothetical protein
VLRIGSLAGQLACQWLYMFFGWLALFFGLLAGLLADWLAC